MSIDTNGSPKNGNTQYLDQDQLTLNKLNRRIKHLIFYEKLD